ncbi:MAG TPA: hypothetical protein VLA49_02855, partial [Anaerolineales bacterium]|nr:hypothetical protein [Anaerolineales bacterium]
SGAVGTEFMEIVDFIAILTAIYGGVMDIIPHIYGVDSMDSHSTELTQKRSQVRVLFRPQKSLDMHIKRFLSSPLFDSKANRKRYQGEKLPCVY